MQFQLVSDFKPTGDQPQAIQEIVSQFENNHPYVTLQGGNGFWKNIYHGKCS